MVVESFIPIVLARSAMTSHARPSSTARTAPDVLGALNSISVPSLYARAAQREEIHDCEGTELNIACHRGGIIVIGWALYGRVPGATYCSTPAASPPCGDSVATTLRVRERCQGLAQCSFRVTNGFFGGDPCLGVYKYLVTVYACIDGGQ